jgi:hypothetical protein
MAVLERWVAGQPTKSLTYGHAIHHLIAELEKTQH